MSNEEETFNIESYDVLMQPKKCLSSQNEMESKILFTNFSLRNFYDWMGIVFVLVLVVAITFY